MIWMSKHGMGAFWLLLYMEHVGLDLCMYAWYSPMLNTRDIELLGRGKHIPRRANGGSSREQGSIKDNDVQVSRTMMYKYCLYIRARFRYSYKHDKRPSRRPVETRG